MENEASVINFLIMRFHLTSKAYHLTLNHLGNIQCRNLIREGIKSNVSSPSQSIYDFYLLCRLMQFSMKKTIKKNKNFCKSTFINHHPGEKVGISCCWLWTKWSWVEREVGAKHTPNVHGNHSHLQRKRSNTPDYSRLFYKPAFDTDKSFLLILNAFGIPLFICALLPWNPEKANGCRWFSWNKKKCFKDFNISCSCIPIRQEWDCATEVPIVDKILRESLIWV